MKKVQVSIAVILVLTAVLANLNGTISVAAQTQTRGAITVAFDDGRQNVYDYAFPLLQQRGIKATFYVTTDWINSEGFMTISELQTLHSYGCEIDSHSHTHAIFTAISDEDIEAECEISREMLQSWGFPANNFAYPSGFRNEHTDSIVAEYYQSARKAYEGYYLMEFPVSTFLLPGWDGELGDSTTLSYLESLVDDVSSTNTWAIIFFHNVLPGVNDQEYTISAEDFASFLDYIQTEDVATITVDQGLRLSAPPAPAPSVTISPTSVRMDIGQSIIFTSSISAGNPPYSYQWYRNDSGVSGATGSTWTFTPTSTGSYKVYLYVTDVLYRVQSNIVTNITVYPQPVVTISPTSVNMTVGGTQQFTSAVAGGLAPYTYQWYYSNGTALAGATASTLAYKANQTGTYTIYLNATDSTNYKAKSNNATINVYSQPTVTISPTSVKMYFGQTQTFNSSVSGGYAPYTYQWFLNDTAVSGATGSTWTFTPKMDGHYKVYLNVTDGLNSKAQSNIVSDVLVCTVYLLLTPDQDSYVRGQLVTFTVNVFSTLDPALKTSLILTIVGPANNGYFDTQPISVPVGVVGKYIFSWIVPDFSGKYVVEANLAPSLLTAYDAAWLEVT